MIRHIRCIVFHHATQYFHKMNIPLYPTDSPYNYGHKGWYHGHNYHIHHSLSRYFPSELCYYFPTSITYILIFDDDTTAFLTILHFVMAVKTIFIAIFRVFYAVISPHGKSFGMGQSGIDPLTPSSSNSCSTI